MYYRIAKDLARAVCLLARVKAEGQDNVPGQGAAIIAANHRSAWDSLLIGAFTPRVVHFMTKEELFNNALLGGLLTRLHAIPVKKATADRRALREALEILEKGEVLGIFPEGTRSKTGELSKPHNGIALLALKSGAPVIPVSCVGTDAVHRGGGWFNPVVVRFGKPVNYRELYRGQVSAQILEEVSKDIMLRISELMRS